MEILQNPQKIIPEQEPAALKAQLQEQQRLRALEWPLQAGWFEYRVNQFAVAEIEALAQQVAEHEPSSVRREYILSGSFEVKKDALITDLVDPEGSLAGSLERQWFRAEALKQPLDTRFKEALDLMEGDTPERAFVALNSYYLASTQQH